MEGRGRRTGRPIRRADSRAHEVMLPARLCGRVVSSSSVASPCSLTRLLLIEELCSQRESFFYERSEVIILIDFANCGDPFMKMTFSMP